METHKGFQMVILASSPPVITVELSDETWMQFIAPETKKLERNAKF